LDLSKTQVKNHFTNENYDKQTSNNFALYAPVRIAYQTKFPAQDINDLEKKLENPLLKLLVVVCKLDNCSEE
jgi:hypothetical protein